MKDQTKIYNFFYHHMSPNILELRKKSLGKLGYIQVCPKSVCKFFRAGKKFSGTEIFFREKNFSGQLKSLFSMPERNFIERKKFFPEKIFPCRKIFFPHGKFHCNRKRRKTPQSYRIPASTMASLKKLI